MLQKLKNLPIEPLIEQFKDVRMLGFVAFGLIVLLVSWSGVNVIQSNYVLQKQIAELQQKAKIAELENTNLKLQNQYYDTDQYVELMAREQFGKGLSGETLLLVPKSVALAHTIDQPPQAKAKPAANKPKYQQNFEAWRAFLFHQS